jgi:hypothetical protein
VGPDRHLKRSIVVERTDVYRQRVVLMGGGSMTAGIMTEDDSATAVVNEIIRVSMNSHFLVGFIRRKKESIYVPVHFNPLHQLSLYSYNISFSRTNQNLF